MVHDGIAKEGAASGRSTSDRNRRGASASEFFPDVRCQATRKTAWGRDSVSSAGGGDRLPTVSCRMVDFGRSGQFVPNAAVPRTLTEYVALRTRFLPPGTKTSYGERRARKSPKSFG
jgi:hypothetical protein